jgi:hypothetical protein
MGKDKTLSHNISGGKQSNFRGNNFPMKGHMSLEIIRPTIVDLVVPAILLASSTFQIFNSKFQWILWMMGMAAYVAYTFIKGEWFLFGYYLRFILPLSYGTLIAITYKEIMGVPIFAPIGLGEMLGFLFLVLFLTLTLIALRDRRHMGRSIKASFPFRNGNYYIAHGGSNFIINHHAPAEYSKFAIDILKLNKFGFRAKGFYPKDLDKYLIFKEILYAPVAGIAIKVVDEHPDMVPPNQDHENPAGNYVIIKHAVSNALVFLVHLHQKGMFVSEGDVVIQGQPIGRVGNSGLSTEPHLHIHCEEDEEEEFNTSGRGIPLLFDGRFLKRNDLVKR